MHAPRDAEGSSQRENMVRDASGTVFLRAISQDDVARIFLRIDEERVPIK